MYQGPKNIAYFLRLAVYIISLSETTTDGNDRKKKLDVHLHYWSLEDKKYVYGYINLVQPKLAILGGQTSAQLNLV